MLYERIEQYFRTIAPQNCLTLGVEQEFFLLREGQPVSHEQSQQFLSILPGFSPQYAMDETLGQYIEATTDANANRIKYDHHPFLFEIEIAHSSDLSDTKCYLHTCFDAVYQTAAALGLEISFDPVLPISTADNRTHSNLKFRKDLISYRTRLFQLRGETADEAIVNYAAGIAATQVHIGGVPFEYYDAVFPELYRQEGTVLEGIKAYIQSHLPADEVLKRREYLYKTAFRSYPLAAFPAFEWSVKAWTDALENTPLFGSEEEYFSGRTLLDFPELTDSMPMEEFLYRVRDLQWIKPHHQGTIEFRACPALPDVEAVMELCNLRLGTVKNLYQP